MKHFLAVLVFLGVLVGVFWGVTRSKLMQPHEAEPVAASTPTAPPASPLGNAQAAVAIHYPVPAESESAESGEKKPLPAVDESDDSLQEALTELFGKQALKDFFNPAHLVRRIVVTIDNLPSHRQPSEEYSPLKGINTPFRTARHGGDVTIAKSNFDRYATMVALIQGVDMRKLVEVYVHFYPLFQSAFQDLGKPGYFNDRLVQVVEHLLKTPDISGPIEVTRPTKQSRYKFVDDRLEGLSAEQKLLVRMGPENEHKLKKKLGELHALLIRFPERR